MIKQLLKYCLNLLFQKIKDIQIYDDVYIQIDNQIYTA